MVSVPFHTTNTLTIELVPGAGASRMVEIVATDDALVHRCRLLTSMPGVGAVLACTLIALLPELGRMGGCKCIGLQSASGGKSERFAQC